MRSRVAVRAVVCSVLASLLPAVLAVFPKFVEGDKGYLVLFWGGLLSALLMVPAALLATAFVLRVERPLRAVPWLIALLGPIALGVACLYLQGPQRRARLWWTPDAVDVAIDRLFVLGNAALLAAVARRRTGRWNGRALAWAFAGSVAWTGVTFSMPHTDVLSDGLVQTALLFPVWTLTLVPPFAIWTFRSRTDA